MWFASASLFLPTVFRFLSCLSIGWPLRRVHSTVSDSFALSSGSLLFLRFSIRAVRSLCSAGSRFTVCFRFVLNVSLLFLRFSSQFRGLAHMSRSVSSGSLIFLIFRFSSPFRTVRSSCSLVLCLLPFERSAHITQILQPTSDSSLRFSSPFRTARSFFSDSLIPDERCSPFSQIFLFLRFLNPFEWFAPPQTLSFVPNSFLLLLRLSNPFRIVLSSFSVCFVYFEWLSSFSDSLVLFERFARNSHILQSQSVPLSQTLLSLSNWKKTQNDNQRGERTQTGQVGN